MVELLLKVALFVKTIYNIGLSELVYDNDFRVDYQYLLLRNTLLLSPK